MGSLETVAVVGGSLAGLRSAEALRRLGFPELRVRHYRDLARIELPIDRLPDAIERRSEIVAAVRGIGYRYATLDLEGLRSGNLNDALEPGAAGETAL